ncbi:hypothetical protein ABZX85_17285 [Streptomyces sp. NPDC004539]|uniref:hypothetical protein n=1 Tax=Streptomyces sp. NPDC004539 TaxID=3154280 RepID=UPI0033B99BF7
MFDMFDHQAAGKRSSRRGRTAGAVATACAALIAIAVGTHPAAASATPSAEPSLGTGNLLQSEDLVRQGLSPVGATVALTGEQSLSACSGEETMRTLTRGKSVAYAEAAWSFATKGTLLTESVAAGSTATSAASYEAQLNKLVRGCQNEPAGHWYYGKAHAFTVEDGRGNWYPSYNGDGEAAGGVAVIRSGLRVGIVELTGTPGATPGHVAGIATGAVHRLAG